jgi:hypothetical protein
MAENTYGHPFKPGHPNPEYRIHLNSCFYCQEGLMSYNRTADHVLAESKGGIRSNDNKLPSCTQCNEEKSEMTPEEYLRYLQIHLKSLRSMVKKEEARCSKIMKNLKRLITCTNEYKSRLQNNSR